VVRRYRQGMSWLGEVASVVEKYGVAGARWVRGIYLRRRPWAVVLDIEHLERYLPEQYIGDETPFHLLNRGPLNTKLVKMVVRVGPKHREHGYPEAEMDLGLGKVIPAGGATATTSFSDMTAGKTRWGRITWVDARGQHRQIVRIPSIGTYSHTW